eukprot:NODE_915_length_1561_cov_51.167364_g904_i0.p1 GENE.NODE_915_length_1561_cov_51.167364_g904_i0~~NODE_915_length_1561_cov_51.167364_g904_i0.p1  ORF type:complete len:479 (-),score=75.29 NODE_915_length_1561_cov_51.167364_g904_i0:67-1503(-)
MAFRVHVLQGRNIVSHDIGAESDPYVILKQGSKKVQTSVKKNTATPKWNETLEVNAGDGDKVEIVVMDKDVATADDFIGSRNVTLSDFRGRPPAEEWMQVYDNNNRTSGEILLVFEEIGGQPPQARGPPPPPPAEPRRERGHRHRRRPTAFRIVVREGRDVLAQEAFVTVEGDRTRSARAEPDPDSGYPTYSWEDVFTVPAQAHDVRISLYDAYNNQEFGRGVLNLQEFADRSEPSSIVFEAREENGRLAGKILLEIEEVEEEERREYREAPRQEYPPQERVFYRYQTRDGVWRMTDRPPVFRDGRMDDGPPPGARVLDEREVFMGREAGYSHYGGEPVYSSAPRTYVEYRGAPDSRYSAYPPEPYTSYASYAPWEGAGYSYSQGPTYTQGPPYSQSYTQAPAYEGYAPYPAAPQPASYYTQQPAPPVAQLTAPPPGADGQPRSRGFYQGGAAADPAAAQPQQPQLAPDAPPAEAPAQ